MYELFTTQRTRNEKEIYQKWYVANQMGARTGRGIKPVLDKILDSIGL